MIYWMGGPFDILKNADELYSEASKRLLTNIESNHEIGKRVRIILEHLDNSKTAFLNRINQLYKKRDQWMIPFFDAFEINDDKRQDFENIFKKQLDFVNEQVTTIKSISSIRCGHTSLSTS